LWEGEVRNMFSRLTSHICKYGVP